MTRGRPARHASLGLATTAWPRSNGGACHRRVRSLPRRLVQAVQPGAWRQVKRLSDRWVHACAVRAIAVKRVPEPTGQKTPGGEGDLGDPPAKHAAAVAHLGRWRGDRPAPLQRIDLPKNNGPQRPRSLPTRGDRARQAVSRQALPPIAAPTGEQHSDGCRPTRRGAEAIDQGFKVWRQNTAAAWIWAGDLPGVCAHLRCSWREHHLPLHQRVRSKWLRRGVVDPGALLPTTAGVPHGGLIAAVISHRGWDGREALVQGGHGHRRVHTRNEVRWADDFSVTANSREV